MALQDQSWNTHSRDICQEMITHREGKASPPLSCPMASVPLIDQKKLRLNIVVARQVQYYPMALFFWNLKRPGSELAR